jgi:hypothetical protein
MAMIVLDAGNSRIKAKNGSGKEVDFIHSMAEISASAFGRIMARNGKAGDTSDYIYIENLQRYFVVGESAQDHGTHTQETGPARYRPDYYGVFALAAITRLYTASSLDVSIFAAHPPGHIDYAEDLLRSVFGDWHVVTNGTRQHIKITYGDTFDEPAGGLSNVMFTEDGKKYAVPFLRDARLLTIDIGGGTVDFMLRRETGEIDYGLAESIPIGINNVLRDFERDLKSRYKAVFKNSSTLMASRLREAFKSGVFVGGGRELECGDEAAAARNRLITQIMEIYRDVYGGAMRYDAILLTGGGSGLLVDHLIEPLEIAPDAIYLADGPDEIHLANVRGGLKLWKVYERLSS